MIPATHLIAACVIFGFYTVYKLQSQWTKYRLQKHAMSLAAERRLAFDRLKIKQSEKKAQHWGKALNRLLPFIMSMVLSPSDTPSAPSADAGGETEKEAEPQKAESKL